MDRQERSPTTIPLVSIREWPGTTPGTIQEEERYENPVKEPIHGWLNLVGKALHWALQFYAWYQPSDRQIIAAGSPETPTPAPATAFPVPPSESTSSATPSNIFDSRYVQSWCIVEWISSLTYLLQSQSTTTVTEIHLRLKLAPTVLRQIKEGHKVVSPRQQYRTYCKVDLSTTSP